MMITDKTSQKPLDSPQGVTMSKKPGRDPPILCKVHQARIEGLNYFCHKCGSVFCLACIAEILLPEGKCVVCDASLEISEEFRCVIDQALSVRQGIDGTDGLPKYSGITLTMLTPEVWKRLEELQLDDDIIEEVIDKLKYIPPDDRLKYLDAYFEDNLESNDD